MRKTWLTVVLVGLLVLPLLAQRPRGGQGGQQGGDFLLIFKSVQEELKLDDKQKKDLASISEKQAENTKKMFEMFKEGEKDKAMEVGKKMREEMTKSLAKVRAGLTSTQFKRFTQIEIQQATKNKRPGIFAHKEVEKILKLSDKQKETIKETLSDLEKDVKEVMDEAKDFKKKGAAFKKTTAMRGETYEKITKSLTKDQQKAWETAGGEEFKGKLEFGGGKKRKNKDEKKKDDF
jgi:hypothetical protein